MQKTGYKILYVDDSEEAACSKKDLLGDLGHFVLLYHNAESVIDDLEELNYDVALVDRQLFEHHNENFQRNGDELMQILKRRYPERPIISLTAYNMKSDYADYGLFKPSSIRNIDDEVRRAMFDIKRKRIILED